VDEEIVVIVMAVSAGAVKSALSVTNMVTLHVNARRTRIFATVATELDILQKNANRVQR
jgi:hypothetical protein